MTWNYRVIEFLGVDGEPSYRAIHEVHYDEVGKPRAYTAREAVIGWDTDEGDDAPVRVLERMRESLAKPVLRSADFPAAEPDNAAGVLAPPPGFEGWLEYALASSSAPRDASLWSQFENSTWGREIGADEIRAAIAAELAALRRAGRVHRRPRYTLEELLAGWNPNAPYSADSNAWERTAPVGREFGAPESQPAILDCDTVAIPATLWKALRQHVISDFSVADMHDGALRHYVESEVEARFEGLVAANFDEQSAKQLRGLLPFGPADAPKSEQVARGIEFFKSLRERQRRLREVIERQAVP